jgi:hypothetical protein
MREWGLEVQLLRRAIIIILCIAVVVGGSVGLYFYWHRTATNDASTSGTTPALVSLLPAKSPYVLYADFAALRKSEFLTKLVAMAPAQKQDQDYTDFVNATGFDFTRDLDRVVFAMIPSSPEPVVWAVAEGRFDQQKIAPYALRSGRTEQREGKTIYIVPTGKSGGEVEISFLAPGRIQMVGKQNGISAAIMPGGGNSSDAIMHEHISRVAGASIFAVISADALPKDVTVGSTRLDQVQSALTGIHWVSIAVMPEGHDLKIMLEGETASTREAIQMELGLEGFRILGQGILSDPATRKQLTKDGADSLDAIVKKIAISRDGQRVRLSMSLTPEMLSGLAAPAAITNLTPQVPTPANPKPIH